ncbi:MAG: hypothetical protein OEQ14_00920 [Gammaproteobacteria bacterium]|nr:hypothetical protein [Gammaproteobacteria bacterium]
MRILVVLVTIALAACTGDSDRDSPSTFVSQPVVAGVDAVILPEYGFEVSSTAAGDLLQVSVPGDGSMWGVSVDFGSTLRGEISFVVDDNDYLSVEDYTVKTPSSFTVDSDVGDEAFLGVFDVKVIGDLVYMPNVPHHPPNWGFYQVISPAEIVNVQVIPGPFSSVEISVGAGGSVWLSWDQLAASLDDKLAPAWQRRAALATEVLDFVLIQIATIADTFNYIDDEMLNVNPAAIACDPFTGTPPANVLVQGESTVTWLGPGNAPSEGDNFEWAFTDCWFDDSGSGFDTLFNGSVGLRGYVWELDNEFQLIGAGFREVIYNNLEVTGTVEQPPSVFTISPDEMLTVSGGFDLVFERITN